MATGTFAWTVDGGSAAVTGHWAFEHAAAGLGVLDLDGRHIDVNQALCDLVGRSRTDIIGRHLDELVVLDSGPFSANRIASVRRGEPTCFGAEAMITRPDGTKISALASVAAVLAGGDVPAFFFVQVQDVSPQRMAERSATNALRQLRRLLDDVVVAVARAVELRDPYTAGHQTRVATIAVATATSLGLDHNTIEGIRVGATIHDVGKIAVPAELLSRPGSLSIVELELIKAHAQAGHDVVAGIRFPWPVARMILEHHERMDGSGYPHGLVGDEILLESRVIAVADVLEAVSAHRPYRPSLGLDRAFEIVTDGRGTLFDSQVVDACLHALHRPSSGFDALSPLPTSGTLRDRLELDPPSGRAQPRATSTTTSWLDALEVAAGIEPA